MILETVDILKICLLIALFTGLIFGYLYTKLKVHERYYPDIKKFTTNIKYHTRGLKKIEHESQNLKIEIEHYENKLKKIAGSLFEYKEQFVSQKDEQVEIMDTEYVLKKKYQEKKNILSHYSSEIEKVKKECRLDDIANIEENKESMHRLIGEKVATLKKRHEEFSLIQNKVKDLDLDNYQLDEKFHELGKHSERINLKIVERDDALKSLEKGFVAEYERLYKDISDSHNRLKEYKEKLLKLKNY